MLEAYVKNDETYKAYALKICGCNDLKNDIVNDMYLRLHKILSENPNKEITNGYIYLIMRSIYIDGLRKNNEVPLENSHELAEEEDFTLCKRITIDEALSEMRFFDREILLVTHEKKSLRELGREVGLHHSTISKYQKESLDKLKSKLNNG